MKFKMNICQWHQWFNRVHCHINLFDVTKTEYTHIKSVNFVFETHSRSNETQCFPLRSTKSLLQKMTCILRVYFKPFCHVLKVLLVFLMSDPSRETQEGRGRPSGVHWINWGGWEKEHSHFHHQNLVQSQIQIKLNNTNLFLRKQNRNSSTTFHNIGQGGKKKWFTALRIKAFFRIFTFFLMFSQSLSLKIQIQLPSSPFVQIWEIFLIVHSELRENLRSNQKETSSLWQC